MTQPGTWLFVDASPFFGGHEVMLLRWIEELAQTDDVQPKLLARAGSRLLSQAPESTRCPPFPVAAGGAGIIGELRWLRRVVAALQPQCVVVASGAMGAHIPHVLLLRALGVRVLLYVPMLGTFASMGYRQGIWKDRFVRWFYAKVPRGWVAITEGQAREFQHWARPTGRIFVLPNTISAELEHAPRVAMHGPAAGRPLRVLVLGRLDAHQKGLDMLIGHLMQADPAHIAGLHFSLVGDGPYQPEIESALAARRELARHVTLRPWMSAQTALADSDVLLLCSRYEGVPLVMLEAMALGVPVVCPDLPGTQPYVPASCRFAIGDMAGALTLLSALRPAERRAALADAGRTAFELTASGQAFRGHVRRLVHAVREHFHIVGQGATQKGSAPMQPKLPEN